MIPLNIKRTYTFAIVAVMVLAGLTPLAGQSFSRNDSIFLDPIEAVPIMPSEYSLQAGGNWGIPFLNIDDYSEQIKTKAKRKVAIIIFDTAGGVEHSALKSAEWSEHNLSFTGEASPVDANGHGTHVGGIYSGVNEGAHVGVAAELVKIGYLKTIYYKVLSNQGSGSNTGIYKGMRAANELAGDLIKEGWFVIYNFSLGGSGTNATFDSLMKIASDLGVLVLGAAGNDNTENILTPANGPSVKAIGAINKDGEKAYFSTYGEGLWLCAPGQGIFSTYLNNTYRELSGTSMATPFQGGIAAIVASLTDWSAKEIVDFLGANSTDIAPPGDDKFTGLGFTDAAVWFPALLKDDGPGDGPGDDEPEPPTKKNRDITFDIDLVLPIKWKPLVDQSFQYSTAEIILSISSDKFAGPAYDEARALSLDFFKRYMFFLPKDSDFIDAGFWASYFFESWAKREHDLKIEVVEMIVIDKDNRRAIVPQKSKFNSTIKKLFLPELSLKLN